jgi:hypothetical protein
MRFYRNMLEQPRGTGMTAVANVREVEKLIREKLINPVIDKLLRGQLLLKDSFGRSDQERKQAKGDGGQLLPIEGNIKKFMEKSENLPTDPANVRAFKSTIQQDAGSVPAEMRQKAEAELTPGEKLLWVGVPEGSTAGRGLLGAMIGSAKRKEPEYTLYAITNRRVLLFAAKLNKVGDSMSLGGGKPYGPFSYYPAEILDAGTEDDKRFPQGGSIIFKQVKVEITQRDKNGRTSTSYENHFFGILRVRNMKAVSRLLFETLIRPCRQK